jgi:hypothetical protein
MVSDHRSNNRVQMKPICAIPAIPVQAFNTEIRVTVGGKIESPQQVNGAYSISFVFHVDDYAWNIGKTLRNKPGILHLLHPFQLCVTLFTISHSSPFKWSFPSWQGSFPIRLQFYDVNRPEALRAFFEIQVHHIAFSEGILTVSLDGSVVDKHIGTVIPGYKAEALGIVEPFYLTFGHRSTSFRADCRMKFRSAPIKKEREVQRLRLTSQP